MTQVCQEAIDKIQVFSEKGKSVGTIDVTIEYAPQEGMFFYFIFFMDKHFCTMASS